jgi:hypothetical protein
MRETSTRTPRAPAPRGCSSRRPRDGAHWGSRPGAWTHDEDGDVRTRASEGAPEHRARRAEHVDHVAGHGELEPPRQIDLVNMAGADSSPPESRRDVAHAHATHVVWELARVPRATPRLSYGDHATAATPSRRSRNGLAAPVEAIQVALGAPGASRSRNGLAAPVEALAWAAIQVALGAPGGKPSSRPGAGGLQSWKRTLVGVRSGRG